MECLCELDGEGGVVLIYKMIELGYVNEDVVLLVVGSEVGFDFVEFV